MSKIYIGTSGYSYPHWTSVFYPEDLPSGKWLEFYAQHFSTVELNVTFYRLPQEKTFEGWYRRTPKDFLFVVKGSRFITHVKKLANCQEPLDLLMSRAKLLKEKLGIILWQLPPSFKIDIQRLEEFLKLLRAQSPELRASFEFRHQSWFCQEVYDLLKKYKAALCIADSPRLRSPSFGGQAYWPYSEEITADFIYLRFHGGKELYGSNYSDRELKEWAKKIKKWEKKNLDIYTYFNNDAYGYAVANAKTLKNLTKG